MGSILLSGCNRGIGLELARCFACQSWRVFATCRSPATADELQALAAEHPLLTIHPLDVTDTGQIERLASELKSLPIDILFNNAGIFGPENQGIAETDVEGWLTTLRVNTIAPLQMVERFVENVSRSRLKIIASMGSAMGSLSENSSGGFYAYRTSKAGLHMVMRGLAADLAPRDIISVAFHPGWVQTRMGGPQAPVTPQQSASGLQRVLLGLTLNDSGKLLDYEGNERTW
ncbi:MAG: short-chain dehydrogenase [Desulfuromonas sp.]|nr:MAG: short-chain dehydrogenase [Desulfuromonas sp.]